jgi:hypothetical protein
MEYWDLRKPDNNQRLVAILFPWGADSGLDAQLDSLIGGLRPTFRVQVGVQSAGFAMSFTSKPRWSVSEYLTSL